MLAAQAPPLADDLREREANGRTRPGGQVLGRGARGRAQTGHGELELRFGLFFFSMTWAMLRPTTIMAAVVNIA